MRTPRDALKVPLLRFEFRQTGTAAPAIRWPGIWKQYYVLGISKGTQIVQFLGEREATDDNPVCRGVGRQEYELYREK